MRDPEILGVIGSGAMGAGIAQIGLMAGLDVILFDLNQDALSKAARDIRARLARLVEKGLMAQGEDATSFARLVLADRLEAMAPADVVIEAIIERLEPKQALFAQLETIVRSDSILATNTSSLSVAAIARDCAHKERVCGLHFFNPVPLMKLVEVVVAPGTSPAVAARARALSERLGKTPVTVHDGPGFLVNLQNRAYATEALAITQEGVADPATIDRIMRDAAGFRMGPFELMDLTGIDVNFAATTFIYQGYQHDPRLRTTSLHELMYHAGRFGRKSGQGFHDYSSNAPQWQAPDVPAVPVPLSPHIGQESAGLARLLAMIPGTDPATNPATDGHDVTLVAPIGEDCTTACYRLGLNPRDTVAVDLTALDRRHLTIMAAPGGGAARARVADWLRSHGFTVEAIQDSPGFVLQRILAMIANLGCELAQIRVGAPRDIDLAMKLAQNYPKGPLEWAEWLGLETTLEIMQRLQDITGSDRYRPSLWLRRRAMLGLPVDQDD